MGNDRIRDKGRWSGYFGVETNAYELSRYAPAHPGSEREREREGGHNYLDHYPIHPTKSYPIQGVITAGVPTKNNLCKHLADSKGYTIELMN